MQGDGRASGTNGSGAVKAIMRNDGCLVVCKANGQ
ncbi:hypothetical protein JOC76_000741 [Neobacillus cucumis]|nr:hypothetical protein [Neobacillus cucumis]